MSSKISRRGFVKKSAGMGFGLWCLSHIGITGIEAKPKRYKPPIVISTWRHGIPANKAAMKVLMENGTALDAVEKGVNVSENDPEVTSVGYGGLPDEEGIVTLDACIMDWKWNCGSVAGLEGIKNPISVARKVMELTDHVMLVGEGAKKFALKVGFSEEDLLTEKAREWWLKRKLNLTDKDDWISIEENHDTIGMIAMDSDGNIAGACTTSGLSGKIHGRAGDSPIIGAGMYVDGDVGGAAATGRGEEMIRTCGSHLVVENMRHGMSPQSACEDALKRIIKVNMGKVEFQGAYIAMNREGEIGAASLKKEFQYAVFAEGENHLYDGKFLIEE